MKNTLVVGLVLFGLAAAAAAVLRASGARAGLQDAVFESNAFPPTLSDRPWHRDGWQDVDCLRCHETGVGEAPELVHDGLPDLLLVAQCRSCHVLIAGAEPAPSPPAGLLDADGFEHNAFPPMIPASTSHRSTWQRDDCRLCHDSGIHGAPEIRHDGLPALTLDVKCRTCHVQITRD